MGTKIELRLLDINIFGNIMSSSSVATVVAAAGVVAFSDLLLLLGK